MVVPSSHGCSLSVLRSNPASTMIYTVTKYMVVFLLATTHGLPTDRHSHALAKDNDFESVKMIVSTLSKDEKREEPESKHVAEVQLVFERGADVTPPLVSWRLTWAGSRLVGMCFCDGRGVLT